MFTKIRNPFSFSQLVLLIFSTVHVLLTNAQDTGNIRPPLTNNWRVYKTQVLHDPAKKMIELRSLIPDLIYDLRYATHDNFMNRRMYPIGTNTTFLRKPAAEALQKVQETLKAKGLGLKIFDAYRPWSVTAKFWELVHDERFVANPSKGSGHNRGISVDLTLINLNTSEELNMGTGFDNFTDTAHADFKQLPADVLQNRQILRSAMEQQGFKVLDTEWWHFYLPNASGFEILDIPFRKLSKRL